MTACITHVIAGEHPVIIWRPHLVAADGLVIAACANQLAAERIAQLLETHGWLDFEDVAE